ncbi:hypothetical protein DITRI_Ditri07aG0118200 [Diplodiscus trichospermus]
MTLSLLISDLVLAFMWATAQAFRMCPIRRKEFPQNLKSLMKEEDFPMLDVFLSTADPYKEPPMNVVNTALSLMAYVIQLRRFLSMELNIMERSPQIYFASNYQSFSPHIEKIKMKYENMKEKVEHVVDKGEISDEYITDGQQRQAFSKWTNGFTRTDHPTVIQVISDKSQDKEVTGHFLPNLIYISRQKSKSSPHPFKAGALNVLLRVSAVMTNAPLILTQDCDMYSSDPQTPLRVLCYLSDPTIQSKLAYIQFSQRFHGPGKNDIYASEHKRLFQINPMGLDGLKGQNYVGTCCFFCRRAFFGGPSTLVSLEIPDHMVDKHIKSEEHLSLAHHVADCNYENQTKWGSMIGFGYGSLVEDFYTGYRLQCEGWKGVFCNPERAAFLGDVPITLFDLVSQGKRWCIGLLEVTFSVYKTLISGSHSMGLLMALSYFHYAFWPLALLNRVSIFPKISEPWLFLYVFLFLGAYGQDLLEFVLFGTLSKSGGMIKGCG